MKISIVAAIGENRELGKDNRLIWHIPEDLKRFKELTLGHPVIMGRKTFESIGRVLPDRLNIIVTHDTKYKIPDTRNVVVVQSLEEAIEKAKESEGGSSEIFIIGGGQIFEQAIKFADKLYLTIVDAEFDADTFFPDYSMFTKVIFEKSSEDQNFKYKFLDLER